LLTGGVISREKRPRRGTALFLAEGMRSPGAGGGRTRLKWTKRGAAKTAEARRKRGHGFLDQDLL